MKPLEEDDMNELDIRAFKGCGKFDEDCIDCWRSLAQFLYGCWRRATDGEVDTKADFQKPESVQSSGVAQGG